ncbi:cuticlin-4-like [Artemia franciscana]|uniref:ZP domain-containing protein n=2 Tax=Artemia franciscana TaxID=6661 RepID=A0AA88KU96_ARTSF|nr:hypothetical protein QYM36_018123 [Artemia franciscana]
MKNTIRRRGTWLLGCLLLANFVTSDKLDSSALPLEHRGIDDPQSGALQALPSQYVGNSVPSPGLIQDDLWASNSGVDMPQIKNLQVQCEKTLMRVNIEFDRPFYGMIFSKGHYSAPNCIHLRPGSGQLSATFDIVLNSCGMSSSANGVGNFGQPSPTGTFVENTIIIQYDPLVQEVWDQARRLRCTWYDYYEKSVTFRPFSVDMLNAVTANFLGDNLQCWMQIQVGKGPWASEVSGIVKIGQTMTMVLAIKDDENKFDMLVRNCVAHDGVRAPIQLVDQYGCVTRPKIMSRFQKVRNFGSSASVVSYAYFQAFKFPDSMNVHFQCVIQVCRYNCPEPRCDGDLSYAGSKPEAAALPDPRAKAGAQIPSKSLPEINREIRRPGPLAQGLVAENREGLAVQPEEKRRGRPRSNDLDDLESPLRNATRKRRNTEDLPVLHIYKRDTQEMTDVRTTRIIQVVAPGDVAFNLGNANETVVVQNLASVLDSNNVCMSIPSFIGGLVMLLLLLSITCIVSAFLFIRVRTFDKKGKTTIIHHTNSGYDNTEFVKTPK